MASFTRKLPAHPFIVPNCRMPLEPLYNFAGCVDERELAKRLRVEPESIKKWTIDGGIPDGTADVIAVDRLDVEPMLVWGDRWLDLDGWELDDNDQWRQSA